MVHSVYGLLTETIQKYPHQIAVRYKEEREWRSLTWKQLGQKVQEVASRLIEMEVRPGDRVVILSKTRLEWVLADLGIMAVGACTVPIYHSSVASDVAYIYQDSGACLAIVEDDEQVAKLPFARIWMMKDLGREAIQESFILERVKEVEEEDCATIVYTSGTTGEPKGACITHDNLLYEAQAIEKIGLLSVQDTQLLFLPLAHIFAKVMEIAWLKTGHILCFAESIEKVVENMKELKPTFMAAVPRIYEKVYAKVLNKMRSSGKFKRAISNWALAQQKKPYGLQWRLAKKLVFKKIEQNLRETFGGRLRFFVSGGAPLNPEIAWFFQHAGVTILEGYGLTETTAASCVNLPSDNHIGTVGKPLPGMEIHIDLDGEISFRGRGVFKGYWKRPEQTAEVLSKEGWFKTGDIGVVEPGGFLRITDRKKNIIVTAGGKKIAPQKIENQLKSQTSLISQVLVHGDQKHYLVALVTLDEQVLRTFAERHKLKGTYAELSRHPEVLKRIEQAQKKMNQGLASFEQIKKIKVLEHEFEVGSQLTPTLKVKRVYCEHQYAYEINSMYAA